MDVARTNYDCAVRVMPTYLHLSVTGDNTPENVRRSLRDVIAACTRHGCTRVLLEEHFAGPSLGTVEIFEIVSEASRNAWPTVAQIAYVDTNPKHDPTMLGFAETVAVNRGVQTRLFATIAEAEAWLTESAA